MPEHLKFSPSGASRWLNCPGSLHLLDDDVRDDEFSSEGDAAHQLAHSVWLLGGTAADWIGQEVLGHEVSDEMAEAVQIFLDAIAWQVKELGATPDQVALETFIQHPSLENFGGTADCIVETETHRAIVDLKYGVGVVVEIEENAQLSCYALLAQATGPVDKETTLVVVQPRASHVDGPVRAWKCPPNYLRDFSETIHLAYESESRDLKAGQHCQFCPAKVNCPLMRQISAICAAADSSEMTPQTASEIMQAESAILGYLKAVRAWTVREMRIGEKVPGFKLANAYGHRRWDVDEETLLKKCRSKKLGKKDIYKQTLKTPAQLEKLAGKDFVEQFTKKPHLGTTVVPNDSRKKAVEVVTAADEFESESYE